ncbi:hypothetical protein [Longispora albida]|uniref:hypothetical protein n=1 Tax=Longispora albida TaxID=203523 RepID=UPI0012F76114|nr:hypothetical protein [Longispora albida]
MTTHAHIRTSSRTILDDIDAADAGYVPGHAAEPAAPSPLQPVVDAVSERARAWAPRAKAAAADNRVRAAVVTAIVTLGVLATLRRRRTNRRIDRRIAAFVASMR